MEITVGFPMPLHIGIQPVIVHKLKFSLTSVSKREFLSSARQFNNKLYLAFEGFVAAGILYLILIYFITWGFALLEHRLFKHLRPREV
jgi:ABC-type amino acid transport system permease subunit